MVTNTQFIAARRTRLYLKHEPLIKAARRAFKCPSNYGFINGILPKTKGLETAIKRSLLKDLSELNPSSPSRAIAPELKKISAIISHFIVRQKEASLWDLAERGIVSPECVVALSKFEMIPTSDISKASLKMILEYRNAGLPFTHQLLMIRRFLPLSYLKWMVKRFDIPGSDVMHFIKTKTFPHIELKKAIAFSGGMPINLFDSAAKKYYISKEGAWLHKAKDIQFNDPLNLINWLIRHKPKNEDNCLSYLAQALSFGNKKVRKNLRNLQTHAGAYDYYTSDKGCWLRKAEKIDFDNSFDLINWLIKNKPKNEDYALSTYVLALSFGNKRVRGNLRNWETHASAYDYYTSDKGCWLRKAEKIDFNNSIDLINWLIRSKPKNEDYAIGTYVLALSFGNKKVRENLRNWETNAGAYDYFTSKKGAWLKKAGKIDFNNSTDLISWLIKNKPKNEKNSLSYLVQALRFGNKSVQDKLQVFQRSSGAYTYIIKKHAARKNLNQIYSKLISNGINKEAITTRILKKSCNISLFTYLRNEKNEISRKYLYLTFKVYRAFAEHFLTVK